MSRFKASGLLLLFVMLLSANTLIFAQGAKLRPRTVEAPKPESMPDRPSAREKWFRRGRRAPGRVAATELQKAHAEKLRLREEFRQRLMKEPGAAAELSALTTGDLMIANWVPLGPAPISPDGSGFQDYGPSIGRATSIAVDPSDPTGNTIYIGGAFGGVWRTRNARDLPANVLWEPMIDGEATLAVGAIAVDPFNPWRIIVGTGEANNSGDSYYGLGILGNYNGGSVWMLTETIAGHSLHGMAFSRAAFSETHDSLAVIGANTSIKGVIYGYVDPSMMRGVYYATGNGWSISTLMDGSLPMSAQYGANATSVIWNRHDRRFYATIQTHGIYVSQPDDPTVFTRLPNQPSLPGVGLNSLAACPSNSNVLTCPIYRAELAVNPARNEMFVWIVSADSEGTLTNGGVWRTTDSGQSWQKLDISGMSCTGESGCDVTQGAYNLALMAVPNPAAPDSQTDVYAGAVNIFKCTVRNSDASGSACAVGNGEPYTWMNLTHVYGCSNPGMTAHVHPDQHAFAFAPADPSNVLFFAHDGGISRTLHGGAMQTGSCNAQHPFENISATMGSMAEFVWTTAHPTDDTALIGGTQDNGSAAINASTSGASGQNWTTINNGDGGYNAIQDSNPNVWFTSNYGVSIQRCTGGFACKPQDFVGYVTSSNVGGDLSSFYIPFMLDPQDNNKLLVGTCRLWRGSANDTFSGQALSLNLNSSAASACNDPAAPSISAIGAGGPKTANGSQAIYVGLEDGRIFRTLNADGDTSTWLAKTPPLLLNPGATWGGSNATFRFMISSIVVDPTDATGNTAYATVQGFDTTGVVRTTDGGTTWTSLSTYFGLPRAPTNHLAIDPDNNKVLYAATDVGVYAIDLSASSPSWMEVGLQSVSNQDRGTGYLPNAAVMEVSVSRANGKKQLIATTYGRGVWKADLTSTAVGILTYTPSTVDFGMQIIGTTQTRTIAVSNTGAGPLILGTLHLDGYAAADFNVSRGTCPTAGKPLAPAASCELQVSFTPTTYFSRGADVYLEDNEFSQNGIYLEGSGATSAGADIHFIPYAGYPVPYTIKSSVGIQSEWDVQLANTGMSDGVLNSITFTDSDEFSVTQLWDLGATSLPRLIAPMSAVRATLRFTPMSAGVKTSSVLASSDAPNSPASQTITSTALDGIALKVTPDPIRFGYVRVGSAATLSVNFRNTGSLPSALAFLAQPPSSPFSYTPNCPAQLAPGASCAFQVAFTPTTSGPTAGAITFTTNQFSSNTWMYGNGTNGLGVAPLETVFAAQSAGTTSAPQTVTVANYASSPAVISKIEILGPGSPAYLQTNDCGTLQPNATCSISIRYKPVSGDDQTAYLYVSAADGSVVNATLLGRNLMPRVSFSPPTLDFGNIQVNTTSPTKQVKITNAGEGPLHVTSFAIPASFLYTTTCPQPPFDLAQAGSCYVTVKAAPTAIGELTGTFDVNHLAGKGMLTLTGMSVRQGLTPSTTNADFGSLNVNRISEPTIIKLANGGSVPIKVGTLAVTGQFVKNNDGCSGKSIAPDALCTLEMVFQPTSAGTQTGTLKVPSDAPTSPDTISLHGFATQSQVSLSATSLNFGNQLLNTESAKQSVTITNSGNGPLLIGGVSGETMQDFSADTIGCSSTISPGGNCVIAVVFKPSQLGLRSTNLNVSSDSPSSPSKIAVSGTGFGPQLTVTDSSGTPVTSINFGSVRVGNASSPFALKLTNSGTADLHVFAIDFPESFAQTSNCGAVPFVLAANAACTVNLSFVPKGNGWVGAWWTLYSDAAVSGPSISINGIGTAPAVSLTTTSVQFGVVQVGHTADFTVQVRNSGSDTLNISGISLTGNSSDFSIFNNTCTMPISKMTDCRITLRFAPKANGAVTTGRLVIANDAPGNPHQVTLDGSGGTPQITASTDVLDFGAVPVGTQTAAKSVRISNTGPTPVTITGLVSMPFVEFGYAGCSDSHGNFPATLAAGASCDISLYFRSFTAGKKTASLQISHNAPGLTTYVSLIGTAQDFAPPTVSNSTMTVAPGSVATYSLTIAPASGSFDNPIALSCLAETLPTRSSCTFAPASVTPGAAATDVSLTIATTASSTSSQQIASLSSKFLLAFFVVLPGFVLLVGRTRIQRTSTLLLVVLCLAPVPIWTSCGGGGGGGGSPIVGTGPIAGTPRGTYLVNVQAKSGDLVRTTVVTLVVQ